MSEDKSWRIKFSRLATQANLIIMIPSAGEHTFFELQHLKETNQLGKTIFLMPPRTIRTFFDAVFRPADQWEKDCERMWTNLTIRAGKIGIKFPPYSGHGAVIAISTSGEPRFHEVLTEEFWDLKRLLKRRIIDCKAHLQSNA